MTPPQTLRRIWRRADVLLACLVAVGYPWAGLAVCGLSLALWGRRAIPFATLVFIVTTLGPLARLALALWG